MAHAARHHLHAHLSEGGIVELDLHHLHRFTRLDQYRDIESVSWATQALDAGVPESEVLRALATKSRDNARTPMQWEASDHAGFTTGTPWLPANPNHVEINVEAARSDPDSVFHHYRRLIALRHNLPVVVHGDYHLLLPDDEQVFGYVRTLDDARLTVVANLSGEPAAVDLSLAGEVLLSTHARTAATGTFEPWESVVVLA